MAGERRALLFIVLLGFLSEEDRFYGFGLRLMRPVRSAWMVVMWSLLKVSFGMSFSGAMGDGSSKGEASFLFRSFVDLAASFSFAF